MDEFDDERIGEDVGVFRVRREAMVCAVEGDFNKANAGGVWGERRA